MQKDSRGSDEVYIDMITKEEALYIVKKINPNHKITVAYEFTDKFSFVVVPNGEGICGGAMVHIMKKDGKFQYGMLTAEEMKGAVEIDVDSVASITTTRSEIEKIIRAANDIPTTTSTEGVEAYSSASVSNGEATSSGQHYTISVTTTVK